MSLEASAIGTNRHMCLLLVEPNPELGGTLAAWLQGHGFEVVRASSAKEAHAALNDARLNGKRYDGLLADSSVLGFAGYGVMYAFQDQFPGQPVAAMAGSGDVLIDLWASVHGVNVLRKPFSMPTLALWCDNAERSVSQAAKTIAAQTACLANI
jgi:DNA-binding response OmpR family regulator